MTLAITGGTGFVGARLLATVRTAGLTARGLTRTPRRARRGVEWVTGALDDTPALDRLAAGADAVIHVAGVINAADQAGFAAGNVAGTAALVDAARSAGVQRFIHVSSLAARHPRLSLYGASKAAAERIVIDSGLDWTIVRPPAVYGPGDRETLELFRMARYGLVLTPPGGRLSLVHADDLARLLLVLATSGAASRAILEPDDGREGGWSHRQFAAALTAAFGRRGLALSLPRFLLRAGALVDGLVRGPRAKLTADRVAYFCHPDWVVDPAYAVPSDIWQPAIDTATGLAETAAWYRGERWL